MHSGGDTARKGGGWPSFLTCRALPGQRMGCVTASAASAASRGTASPAGTT
jgi:hypothetical protein